MTAIAPGDLAYAQTPSFQRRVAAALETVRVAATHGHIGVCFSGGKDSLVTLDLVRRVQPDASAAFFDSGCEYPDTYEVVRYYGADTIEQEISLLDLCRYGGYWGYQNAIAPEANVDFGAFMIGEPSARFTENWHLDVQAVGLRAEESSGRRKSLHRHDRGTLYPLKGGTWRLCPIAFWRTDDVWAYIASRKLCYNAIYDKMAEAGIPRFEWRVSPLLGVAALQFTPRITFIRMFEPEIFERLAAEFPYLRRFG